MHAASRAVLLVALAGIAACTGTVPAHNAGMAPAESVTEEPAAADAELLNTYWKILALSGEPVSVAPGKRESHIEGSRLELLDGASGRTHLCEAVYLE